MYYLIMAENRVDETEPVYTRVKADTLEEAIQTFHERFEERFYEIANITEMEEF